MIAPVMSERSVRGGEGADQGLVYPPDAYLFHIRVGFGLNYNTVVTAAVQIRKGIVYLMIFGKSIT